VRRIVTTRFGLLCALACAAWLVGQAPARAADVGYSPTPPSQLTGWEIRAGAFAHGVGSAEEGTVDLNAEIIAPKLFAAPGIWNYFVPHFHAGGMLNLSGKTSAVYAGALWRFPVIERLFVEGFFGGAVHNGSLDDSRGTNALGCNPLFHVGGSVGYQITERWSAIFTFDHLSNGRRVFGTDCDRNVGVNNYGLRLGFSF
jgi:lipid A 3-O-deacylase